MMSHEKLDVYQAAIEFLEVTIQVKQRLAKGYGVLTDQLERAALSISLNIAEGAGKVTRADSARYFAIARGSTFECAAIFDVLSRLQLIDRLPYTKGKELLTRSAAMLTRMSRSR